MKITPVLGFCLIVCSIACSIISFANSQNLSSDEVVILYPTYGVIEADNSLRIPISARVFEPETDSVGRQFFAKQLSRAFPKLSPEQDQRFRQRISYFLVDNEREKYIEIKTLTAKTLIGPSNDRGLIESDFKIPSAEGLESAFESSVAHGNKTFRGRVYPITSDGWSVISDVDDTVKISGVIEKYPGDKIPKQTLIKNTFVEEFITAPGMSKFYQQMVKQHPTMAFHYVTASPRQLNNDIQNMLDKDNFPAGSIHLKEAHLKGKEISAWTQSAVDYKTPIIQKILADFPERKFIFVGDTGEHDPEIYWKIMKQNPSQVHRIFLRDVRDPRFPQVPNHDLIEKEMKKDPRVQVFTDPSKLETRFTAATPKKTTSVGL